MHLLIYSLVIWQVVLGVYIILIWASKNFKFHRSPVLNIGESLQKSGSPIEETKVKKDLGPVEVDVKLTQGIQKYTYQHHPFDIVGWDGFYFPYAFNINDFMPITGKIHQPPPVHQTFQSNGFVICSFVPRLFDYHPDSIPAPYAHSNIDSDEIIYYAEGEFMSRKGIEKESITYHPMGLPHGPQPGKIEESIGAKETNELAVMIDTFKKLNITESVIELELIEQYRISSDSLTHGTVSYGR